MHSLLPSGHHTKFAKKRFQGITTTIFMIFILKTGSFRISLGWYQINIDIHLEMKYIVVLFCKFFNQKY